MRHFLTGSPISLSIQPSAHAELPAVSLWSQYSRTIIHSMTFFLKSQIFSKLPIKWMPMRMFAIFQRVRYMSVLVPQVAGEVWAALIWTAKPEFWVTRWNKANYFSNDIMDYKGSFSVKKNKVQRKRLDIKLHFMCS